MASLHLLSIDDYIITNITVIFNITHGKKTGKFVITIDKTNKLVYPNIKNEGGDEMLITLEAARRNIGYSQKEAANLFGIHYQTLAKLEDDSSNAPFAFIQKIPQIYKIPANNIFFGSKNEFIRLLRLQEEAV